MCDQECYNPCGTSFYHHYMNQHAIMTQFIRQLNQNTNAVNSSYACQACHCDCYEPVNDHYRSSSEEYCSCSSNSSSCRSNSIFSESSTASDSFKYEDQEEYYENDDDESECEFEFNVDAILAMRAAKEELNKSIKSSESDSIVLVDSDKEEFEFVELGSYNALVTELSRTVGGNINKKEELENRKKVMSYLYGEKSSTIGGLETAMAVNFERLCDIHQPSLWPVLPVRL